MAQHGGPIERLAARPFSLMAGTKTFEAFAYLRTELIPKEGLDAAPVFLGPAYGTGTSTQRTTAIQIAISEALERWAGLSTTQAEPICSTHGFAAFPGITSRSPRQAALLEVIERFCIAEFLVGQRGAVLVARRTDRAEVEYFRIHSPHDFFVIFARARDASNIYTYGFAARRTLGQACQHALLELTRNQQHLLRARQILDTDSTVTYFYEKKLIYFSSGEGAQRLDRFLSGFQSSEFTARSVPNLKIDEAIRGPWSKWTNVWRCSFGDELTHSIMLDPEYCLF